MKNFKLGITILSLFFLSCGQNKPTDLKIKSDSATTVKLSVSSATTDTARYKQEIQNMIRKMLVWAESKKNHIDLLPMLPEVKDSAYVGFDLQKLNFNLEKLKATNFFTAAFIENYNQIILTLDKKFRNKEFGKWLTGEMPSFAFANDADPWCDCQDNLSWNLIEVEPINLNNEKGELNWKWGKTELVGTDQSWKDFSYKFNVEKEDGIWKISYLEGFDFKRGVR